MGTPPPGHYPPGHPEPGDHVQGAPGQPYGYAAQGFAQPGYGQPIFQPVVLPQPQAAPQQEEAPQPVGTFGTQVVRGVLILAAVVGMVTVLIGALLIAASPEEYAAPGRQTLQLNAEDGDGLADSVGPGGQTLTQADPDAPPPLPPLPAIPPMQPSSPKRLIIPRIGVNAPIKPVGTDKSGAIETPPIDNHNLVGWYRGGPTAGEAGPAVMLGHKDTRTRSAVFSRLHELRYGDTIEVVRMDGTVAVFTVGGIEQADKLTFPTARVYGDRQNAELRLITCGGTYNRTTGHYVDNVIVYATMTGTRLAKSQS